MIRDHRIEGVLVVQPAGDYGMSDSFSSVSWEPYEDLPQHLQGVEANTVNCIDLYGLVQFAVDIDSEGPGMIAG